MSGKLQIRLRWILITVLILLAFVLWADRMGAIFLLTGGQAVLTEHQDLNNNGIIEWYFLENYGLRIIENDVEVWASPAEWRVSSFAFGDTNHDDKKDLLIVAWKKGSFGEDKPFWVNMNDKEIRCHLFIFNLTEDQVKPVWMSSALHRPINSLEVQDINQDGKNELLVYEGSYSLPSRFMSLDASEPTLWQWQGWGFYLLDNPR